MVHSFCYQVSEGCVLKSPKVARGVPLIPRPLLNINCPGTVSEIFLSCQLALCLRSS